MRRTLVLNEDDLIMVIKDDVVKQIDENRGEMNRTEFVNYLIQYQLKEKSKEQESVSKEEYRQFVYQITELLQNFLQFFISYGMAIGQGGSNTEFQALNQQLESLNPPDDDLKEIQ